MNGATTVALTGLLRQAFDVYQDDQPALAELESHALRLDEPLRLAVAGMVKAGKSTLLNAILGEEIAPTGTGECTRIVTWYRYRDTPRVTMFPVAGGSRSLPVRRVDGRLVFDIGRARAEDVSRLVVDWPVKSLRELTLIDTPGIASLSSDVSARSSDFLIPTEGTSAADAIIYVMRHLHEADLKFLEAFRDTSAGQFGTNALAVLSRADEIGAGRIDSLLAARDIAKRYRSDDTFRDLAVGLVPVAGLLAQTARTMHQVEFATLVELSKLDRAERERLLISVDRFVRPEAPTDAGPEARAALLARFGLFGIRLATVLIGNGISDPTALAQELTRRSGLDELLRLISGQFQIRAAGLKAHSAIAGIETLIRQRPHAGTDSLLVALERIKAGAHEFRELQLLATARTTGLALSPELTAEAERLVGGNGIAPADRLGLAEGASVAEVKSHAARALHRWRSQAESPLADRATVELCQTVVRSCEAILSRPVDGSRASATRLVLRSEPRAGTRDQTEDETGSG